MKNKLFLYFATVLLSVFSTAVMSYISMATPIGPWIETTLVLLCIILVKIFKPRLNEIDYQSTLGLCTAAGSIGGILATGFGFSLPALHFIAPNTFKLWLTKPFLFSFYLTLLAFAAGSFGLLIAIFFQNQLIEKEQLTFAVGELVYKMISIKDQVNKILLLGSGFIITNISLIVQRCCKIIPNNITFISSKVFGFIKIPSILLPLELLPMLLAIGFVTGQLIAWPLFIGILSKVLCIDILNLFYPQISNSDFILAFCSGIVIFNAITGFMASLPKFVKSLYALLSNLKKINSGKNQITKMIDFSYIIKLIVVLSINLLFFSYFKFSISSQLYILFFTFICTYQLLYIAGKTGIAPLGRFATFVLLPGLFIFGFDPVQITFISTFVEVAGGVGCDVMFGQKMAYLASIDKRKVAFFQLLGLIISSISIGFIFWLLLSKFGLGDKIGSLPATKASARALLINIKTFNLEILICGIVFGFLLSFIKVNSMLVLGGILTPPSWSIVLICGSLITNFVKDKEYYYPFWSGVFAANSLWMLIKAVFLI